jgi:DinB superfamily
MKGILIGLLVLLCLAGMVASPTGPTESGCKAVFAKHWKVSKEFTLAVAEAMPAEDYGFKPNPEELSFGQLMIHIASQNSDSCASATRTKPPLSMPSADIMVPPETDKPTAIKLLTLSFDACAKELDAMPPEQWNKEVYKFQGQPVLASEALWYTFTHMAHHRGQAEVYLRMKNIKPPAWRF